MKKNHIMLLSILFLLITTGFMSCKKKYGNPDISTEKIKSITQHTALCSGYIYSDSGAIVKERGVCWSTSSDPTINMNKSICGVGTGIFSCEISGLKSNTKYYVRAYATNSVGTSYGKSVPFKTVTDIVKDIDGNVYHAITIGTQVWLVENLKVTHYLNGDKIPNVTDLYVWASQNVGAYQDNGANGKFYNWFVVSDSRGVCPKGWHVPSVDELRKLVDYLGGENTACSKLANLVSMGNAEICNNGMGCNVPHWWSSTKAHYAACSLRFINP